MFGSPMFGCDPFFSSHQEHISSMQSHMNGLRSSMMIDMPGFEPMHPMIQSHRQSMMPFGGAPMFGGSMFSDIFGHVNQMMNMVPQQMNQIELDPSNQFYSSSSVMSFSNVNGTPEVYQASASTMQGPHGVKETRKAVRDSRTGEQKMSIGRHLGDRAHVMTKSKNARTGEHNEDEELVNLDDDDKDRFSQEWQERAGGGRSHRAVHDNRNRYHPTQRHAISYN